MNNLNKSSPHYIPAPNMDIDPKILVRTKEGFRAVLRSTSQGIRATVLNASIPRCLQIQHVPVVFNNPYTQHDFNKLDSIQWHQSHIQLVPAGDSSVLFIGRIGLHGGGHSCSKCATYYCDRCHYYCPNGRCYDYCTHRSDHNCASRQAAQRREQEEREERRRRAQEERERQERLQREREQQERLRREREAREREQQEQARLERERQERLRQEREQQERLQQQREQEQRERERQEQARLERERQERLRQERERLERLRQQREQEQRERERQERIDREKREQEQRERERQERIDREKREREQRERERQERIAQEEREKKAIKSSLKEAMRTTTAIRDDELDYVSEEETEECRHETEQRETGAIQQEGPIEATETDYGNMPPQSRVNETRLLFEALDVSEGETIEYFEKDCSGKQISEQWYKQVEIVTANSSKLIDTLLTKLEKNMSNDFRRLAKYAIDRESIRENNCEIFGKDVSTSKQQIDRQTRRTLKKQSLAERRHELIAQAEKQKAFLQLSKVVRRNLRKVNVSIQQQLLEYVYRGGKLQTRVIKRFPVVRWIEQSLVFELIAYPEGEVDAVLLDVFKNLWVIVRESFEWKDRQNLLYALRTEQLNRELTLIHVNDVLEMIVQAQFDGLMIVCKRETSWYRNLKRCWIRRKVTKYGDVETYAELVELLVNLPWNSLMTQQFMITIAGERNQMEICNFLYKVRDENICHPIVMDIITKTYGEDCAIAWVKELKYHILIREIFTMSPEVARDINSKLGPILRKDSSSKLHYFVTSNKHILEPNMTKFASILEHALTYQVPEIWDEIGEIINSEKNPEKWIGKVDQLIVSTIFGKSYEYSVDELIERITGSSLNATNLDRDNVKSALNSVKSAIPRFSFFKKSATEIQRWAEQVKLNYDRVTLEEKIAMVIRAVELCHGFVPRDTQILSLLILLNTSGNHGRLAQINTGEGKSIIVAMLAVIHALKGVKVDVVTTSTELSIPEVKKQRPFFELFGLTVDENSPDKDKKVVYGCDVVYGTASDFQGDILRTEFLGNDCRGSRKHQVIIVDEVDSMLFDSRTHSVRLADENPGMTHLEVPLAVIWHHIHNINSHMVALDGKVYFVTEDFEAAGNQIKLYSGEDWTAVSTEVHDKKKFITKHTEDHLRKLLRKLMVDEQNEYDEYQALNLRIMDKAEQFSKEDEEMKTECEKMKTEWEKLKTECEKMKAEHEQLEAAGQIILAGLAKLRMMDKAEQLTKDDEKMKAECEKMKAECENTKAELEKMRADLVKLPWNNRHPVVDIPEHLRKFALSQISTWVKNAILAKWAYKKDAHYTVVLGRIVPVNFNETGDLQTNMIWSDGLTQFLQMKEGLRMDPEGISTNFISNVSFFQRYGSNIFGLTGTLGEQSTQEFLQAMYGTDMVVIPPYKTTDIANNESSGYRCKELTPLVLSNQARWYQNVKENALYHAQNGRGVLVICKYINQARHLANMMKKVHDSGKVFIYTGEQTNFEKETIDSGEIIVATNIAGRGTDIKTSKDVEKHGGMCVLVTFLPESFRVEMQNVGRTAREGKRGMAQLIVFDGGNSSMDVLKKIRQVNEAQATTAAIDDAKKMLIQDCLFSRFCLLENELLPSMEETRKMHTWELLNAGWVDYSANRLHPRTIEDKAVKWSEKSHQEFVAAALKSLTRDQRAKLTEEDMVELRNDATAKVSKELPAFKKRYIQNVWSQYCSNQSTLVPSDQLSEFKNGIKFNPKCSELATRYSWGTFERKALEESWGLWLKSKDFDGDQISAEEVITMFRNEFEDPIQQRAYIDKLVRNPFFYVLKGNEKLDATHFDVAIKCYDRAIDLDTVFSVNARYCKAQGLLSYSENRGYKQREALRELRKAKDLIKSVYRPNLLTFNTLIGQQACLEQTSQHVQHQLDIISQQEDFIHQACEIIETAQKNDNNVKLTVKSLHDVFTEAKEDHGKAIREAYGNGLKNLFTVEEKLPRPWCSIIAVALIGVAQIAAGCLIVMYTGGSLGTGLIAEGVADLIMAATAAIKGTFSWAAWATQKVISIAVSIVCSGIASIKQTAKEAGNLGVGTIKQAGKTMMKNFKSGLKDVSRTCFDIGKGIARPEGAVGLAIKEVGLALGKGIVKECLSEAGKYCTDKLFMKNLEDEISATVSDALIRALSTNPLVVKALEEDERTGTSYWKQLFIKEGMKLLKDKEINKCVDMFKDIAKGVAVGSIPYAGSVMEVAGVAKCMYTLNTYTENFIKKFNKAVSSHEKKINQQINESNKSNSSEQSQFTTNRTSNQASSQNVGQAPDMDCDDSDISVHQVTEDTVYSSKIPSQTNTNLRSTYREASTPKTLANAFKGTITGKLTTSIQENIVNPAMSHVTAHVTKGLFHSMEESVANLRNQIKTERDNRSESNAMANSVLKETPLQDTQELGPETAKMVETIIKDDHLHDTTSLALSSSAVNAPIYVYDEKGKLKYIVGSKLPGPPISIKHYAPSKDHPVGHFTPLNPNVQVAPSGTNTCALDAVVSQLSPTQKDSLQVNNTKDLRIKMVQQVIANPRQAEQMYEKRAELERIAPRRIISGGQASRCTEKQKNAKFRRENYKTQLGEDIEEDSETKEKAKVLSGEVQMQTHHLIHYQLRDHPVLKLIGFNINDPLNLLACPANEESRAKLDTNRSVHRGPHPQKVEKYLDKKLNRIHDKYLRDGDVAAAEKAVYELSHKERRKVRHGVRTLRNDAIKRPNADPGLEDTESTEQH